MSLTVEVYLRWKLQISPFFVSGKTWKISSVSNTYLLHCIYIYISSLSHSLSHAHTHAMLLWNLGSTVALDLYNNNIVWHKKNIRKHKKNDRFCLMLLWGGGGGGGIKSSDENDQYQKQNYDKTQNTIISLVWPWKHQKVKNGHRQAYGSRYIEGGSKNVPRINREMEQFEYVLLQVYSRQG